MTQASIHHPFINQYAAFKGQLAGSGTPWLEALREAGMARFNSTGLPTPRIEAWKYTNLCPLDEMTFLHANDADCRAAFDVVPDLLSGRARTHRLVFVNGRFRAELSDLADLPQGVSVRGLDEALRTEGDLMQGNLGQIGKLEKHPLLALNTAMMDDGVVVRVGRGVEVSSPIELVFVGGLHDKPLSYHPRNLVLMDENSRANLIEHYVGRGDASYFANVATEIRVRQGARVNHYSVQMEGARGYHLNTVTALVDRDGRYDNFKLSMGGELTRNETSVRLEGEGSHTFLGGAYLMRGKQHCDNTTLVQHCVEHTSCEQVFKGVLDDQARGVFQGKIIVDRAAQHTDGHQLSKALLLNSGATHNAKPELEIYADDVKCSHGATSGELDHQALFYLRSRGIPLSQARSLLIQSFLGEALENISLMPVRDAITDIVLGWLTEQV
ncbi:MAG: Fe-S cluster assembly protein SufD [Magnetovibrionaceae bacterium]